MNADDYVLATGMTTRMRHVVRRWDTTPSMLVMGSKDYDTDVHRRALCGSITEFTDAEASDDPDECCFRCWHTAFARDLVDDPAPFNEEDMASNKRPVTDGGAEVPMVRERNGGVETVRGPEPVAYQAWERDRGQVTVLAKVVLFVIVSFLLVFAIAAFNGVMP